MKKTLLYGLLSAGMVLGATSCSDFLEPEPANNNTTDKVYSDWNQAVAAHIDTYNFLRHGAHRINNSWLDAATDLAYTSYSTGGVRTSLNIGNYYGSSGAPELTASWEHFYRGIRKCNQTIEKLPLVPKAADLSEETYTENKNRYISEAYFLRAFFHWELFLRYGAIPYIDEVMDPTDQATLLSKAERPSTSEYVGNILADLETSREHLLPYAEGIKADYSGEISQPMCDALKCKVLLYMASPRFAAESGKTWNDAMKAYEKFFEDYPGYELTTMSAQFDTPAKVMTAVWQQNQYAGNNKEVIFFRNDPVANWGAIAADVNIGEGGSGGCCPSQNLVDMFDMADGTSPFASYDITGAPVYTNGVPAIAAGSTYTDQTMWENRDPRLEAYILHHGMAWGYQNPVIDVRLGGADNKAGNANATKTGYYMRKWIADDILSNNHGGTSYRNWCFIRLAEMYLSYAEILNEISFADNKAIIAAYLDMVRMRAGLPQLATRPDYDSFTQETMRNFIHKERTIELCFEEQRWWDVRRWSCAVKALSRPIYGIEVAQDGKITRKTVTGSERQFDAKMYLYPIPEAQYWIIGEYANAQVGIQDNPGWGESTVAPKGDTM